MKDLQTSGLVFFDFSFPYTSVLCCTSNRKKFQIGKLCQNEIRFLPTVECRLGSDRDARGRAPANPTNTSEIFQMHIQPGTE
jgi:hypothetical protein